MSNILSAEFHKERAQFERELGALQEQEPAYDEYPADAFFIPAEQHDLIAKIIQERGPFNHVEMPDSIDTQLDEESIKRSVLGAIHEATEHVPPASTSQRLGLFKNKTTVSKTVASRTTNRAIEIADIDEETTIMTRVSDRKRYFQITESDGVNPSRYPLDPGALVKTVFKIDKMSGELSVSQRRAYTVSSDLAPVFPSLGVHEQSSAAQWARLSQLVVPSEVTAG